MSNHRIHALIAVLLAASFCFGDSKTPQQTATPGPMTKETRMLVIRSLNAELAFVRKPFPMGENGITIKDGVITPDNDQLQLLIAQYGLAAKPGDRARITNVEIKKDRIRFEINGGPKKKTKWYQHIQVGGMGGMTQVGPPDQGGPPPTGSYVDLVFDKYVPDLTGDQIRNLLAPVLDFHSKSAAEAYLDTVPPIVKQAIKDHQVLVGMNREMVTYAKGRPQNKIREKDKTGVEYEEWIYGQPPQQVDFVRFVGDEVVRLEEMKVDGTKLVRTEKQVDVKPTGVSLAKKEQEKRPAHAPTLRRPGEKPELGTGSDTMPSGSPMPPPDTTPGAPQPPNSPPTGLPPM